MRRPPIKPRPSYSEPDDEYGYDPAPLRAFEEERRLARSGEEDGFGKRLSDASKPAIEICEDAASVSGLCDESPIERQFATALKRYLREIGQPFVFCAQSGQRPSDPNILQIIPQFKWKRWRYDFAIGWPGRGLPSVVVECDGKEFHSRLHQMQNDWNKDDEAERLNIPIVRFKGSEIFHDARACVIKTLEALS